MKKSIKNTKKNFGPAEIIKIGQRLKSVRKALGWTLEKMHNETGFSLGYISEFELGKTIPASKYLIYLSLAHNVSIDFVLTGRGRMFIEAVDILKSAYDFGKHKDEIDELLGLMALIPNALYSVLAYFTEYKESKEALIKKYRDSPS